MNEKQKNTTTSKSAIEQVSESQIDFNAAYTILFRALMRINAKQSNSSQQIQNMKGVHHE